MSVLLAQNGKSFWNIAVPPDADRVLVFAAKELAKYLNRISGAVFELISREESAPGVIFLSAEQRKSRAKDHYRIHVSKEEIRIQGNLSRSALYGVYEFLENLGCSFLEPGREIIPAGSVLEISEIRKSSTAAFPLRNIFRSQIFPKKSVRYPGLDPETHLAEIDWMAKRKLNHYEFYIDFYRYDLWENGKHRILDALLDRGFQIEVCFHSIGYFFPRNEEEDYGGYGSGTYQSVHPEWYEKDQAKIELPAVEGVITERYLEYIRRNPELDRIGLWPADRSIPAPDKNRNAADGYLVFWNRIAARLAEQYPEKYLSTIAYFELIEPPLQMRGADNEHLWFCPITANWHYPMNSPENLPFLRQLEGWCGKMPAGQVACFDYWGWQVPFIPVDAIAKENLRLYAEAGAGGAYGWSGFSYHLMGEDCRWAKDMYAYANLLWDPSCSIEGMFDAWVHGIFGSAAGHIEDFYAKIRELHRAGCDGGTLLGDRQPWFDGKSVLELRLILDEARKDAESVFVWDRIGALENVAVKNIKLKEVDSV